MLRRLPFYLALFAALVVIGPEVRAQSEPGAVVVADVRGPMDQRVIDFLVDVVNRADAQVVVIAVDSPGLSSGNWVALRTAVEEAPVPVVAWVGPSGATAFGVPARMLTWVGVAGAAPGAQIGYLERTVAGAPFDGAGLGGHVQSDDALLQGRATVGAAGEDAPSFVTDIQPTIGQFIVGLHGTVVPTGSGVATLDTARTVVDEDGREVIVPSTEVRFLKPGLFTRVLRLASRPEAAFFFLVVGLVSAAFEFYAAGVGITAGVAAIALFLSGYGLATLPVNWWAVALVLAGLLLYNMELQRQRVGVFAVAASAALAWGGLAFSRTSPEYPPRWWAVLLIVLGTVLFYAYAMTTVIRARFATRTIGREHLVGRLGLAETSFDPEGFVVVDGARWRARAHRAAGLGPGDQVVVLEVRGIVLEVEPPAPS